MTLLIGSEARTLIIQILNTWQFNILAALLFSIGFNQSYKLVAAKAENDGALTIMLQLVAGFSILLLAPLSRLTFPKELKIYLLLLLAIMFYTINDRLQTTIRKHLEVSVVMILGQLFNVFALIIGIIAFKEPLVFTRILGAFLILLANIYLFYEKGKLRTNYYTYLAVLANLALAIAVSIDIGLSKFFNLPVYIALTLVIPPILIKFGENISLKAILKECCLAEKKWFLSTGVFWGLMILFFLRSFRLAPVSVLIPLWSSSVLLNVLVAFVFLRERGQPVKKVIAALLVMLGIYLTTLR